MQGSVYSYFCIWQKPFTIVISAGTIKGNNGITKEAGKIKNNITRNVRIDDLVRIKSIKPIACQSVAAMRIETEIKL